MQNEEIHNLLKSHFLNNKYLNSCFYIFVDGKLVNDLYIAEMLPVPQDIFQLKTDYFTNTTNISITVNDEMICDKPLYIIFITTKHINLPIDNVYNLHIDIGANSSVKIIEKYITNTINEQFAKQNSEFYYIPDIVTQISTQHYAKLNYVRDVSLPNCIQKSHMCLNLASNSEVSTFNLLQQIGNVSDVINTELQNESATCNHYGIYDVKNSQTSNIEINVKHNTNNCTSKILFKGIATDNAIANFIGNIIVSDWTSNNQARLDNKNLLLMSTAKITSLPALEIYADDVQCSHGTTIGQLDEQALWYLQSRGIQLSDAKSILMDAFLQEIIQLQ